MQMIKQLSELKSLTNEISEDFLKIKKLIYKVIKNKCGSVLVLDDDITVTTLITKILNLHDFNVNTANDIKTFKEKLVKYNARLVVLDFYLNDCDSKDLALEIKSKNIPVIIITSGNDKNIIHFCKENNIPLVNKPINYIDLHQIIKEMLLTEHK